MSKTNFELNFSPSGELVGPIRRFISDFCERVLDDAELSSRIEVAAHELLENAVKYSVGGESQLAIALKSNADGTRSIVVQTRNQAASDNTVIVKKKLEEIQKAEDPFAHYVSLMRKSAGVEEGSGLGLARIRAECEMQLSCELKDNWVCIQVEAALQ